MMAKRDDFSPDTVIALQKRAAFICSNPECRRLTIAPSGEDPMKCNYAGVAAHITAATDGGPRWDANLSPVQRSDISNGIFLCGFCATMVDKNKGLDFPVPVLRAWKEQHDAWVRENLNKQPGAISEIAGTHEATGVGEVTGLKISKPVKIVPGTIVRASGIGTITGTSIQ
jgi:hypothetical protein